jgi:3-dehydroquinate synthase
MKVLQQQFRISYQYPVFFTRHLFHPDNAALHDFLRDRATGSSQKMLVVLDGGMREAHPLLEARLSACLAKIPFIEPVTPFIVLPGGEKVKNDPASYKRLISTIDEAGVDRHSYLLAAGGGSVLDLAGFAAATAHRGIRHIRIPTTVLSQNDSGIGVKNGINFGGKKNFLGTFSPPAAVFNDTTFLATLDDRNWRSGIAEAIKVALIRDRDFFGWLEQHAGELNGRDEAAMEYLVLQCASLHLTHIASGDPFESGSSRPLDFGHWSAHKLEQLSHFSVLHGEAVAIGMALDVLYAEKSGWLRHEEAVRVLALLQRLGFALYHPLLEKPALLDGLAEFREHLGGNLTVMLLREIGLGENIHEMDHAVIASCIASLKERQASAAMAPKDQL